MKNCFGSLNYIFSPHSLTILKEIGLLPKDSKGIEQAGCMIHDVWFEIENQKFCLQFHEIINEVEFLKNAKSATVESISPNFFEKENSNLNLQIPHTLQNTFKLQGFIAEDITAINEKIKQWQFPFNVTLAHPDENFFYKKLSYKKKFPFWCLLLESKQLPTIANQQGDVSEIQWKDKKAIWIHLETTAWDLLIYEGS